MILALELRAASPREQKVVQRYARRLQSKPVTEARQSLIQRYLEASRAVES